MPKVLFFAEGASLAHVARPVCLAGTLGEAWEVHLACPDGFEVCFQGVRNIERHALSSIGAAKFMARLDWGVPAYSESELTAYVDEDLALIRKLKPDVVVGDFRLSLSVAARVAGVPYAAICNAQWSPAASPPGGFPLPDIAPARLFGEWLSSPVFNAFFPMALRLHARPLDQVRRRYGLPALGDLRITYTDADLSLFADTPSMVPVEDDETRHAYIGPIVWSPKMAAPDWWPELQNARSAYVSLGSTGDTGALPQLLEVIESAGYRTIVATAGRATISAIDQKRYVAPFVSGEGAAKCADFVVCNGGTATAYQALSCGKAVVGVCSNMDQFLTMRYIEASGAGVGMRASTLSPALLEKAVARVKHDETVIAAAKSVESDFARHRYAELFPAALATLM